MDDLRQDAKNALIEMENGSTESLHEPVISVDVRAFLKPQERNDSPIRPVPRNSSHMDYLLKVDFPLTPTILARAAVLSMQPIIINGEGEEGTAQFCKITSQELPKLKAWLAKTCPTFRPIFVPINKARKELSPFSEYPTWGVDTTLPQNRPQSLTHAGYAPAQDQYPVWYFFYGTLADPCFLAELFGLPADQAPVLVEASIIGGKIRTWGGKYKALVNCSGGEVEGWACEVMTEEQEDALRVYETAKYEVVRVQIKMQEGTREEKIVVGCTFRFVGGKGELG